MRENSPVVTSAYRGTTESSAHGRSIASCEYSWQTALTKPIRLDDLIINQLTLARAQARKTVSLLDIGSGDAEIFREILTNRTSIPHTKAFLSTHPDMEVYMLGLTDAKASGDFGKPDPSFNYSPEDRQLSGANILYTLTANQRLSSFLQSQDVPKVDLILATCSLQYLGFLTFRQTIVDSISALRTPGSIMVASAYSYLTPGVIGLPDQDRAKLTIPASQEPENAFKPNIKNIMRDKGGRFKDIQGPAQLALELQALKDALELLRRLNVIEARTLQALIERMDSPLLQNSPESYFGLANTALRSAERKLAKTWTERAKKKKTAVLEELQTQLSSQVRIDIQPRGIGGFSIEKI
jgi:hypothetical protein